MNNEKAERVQMRDAVIDKSVILNIKGLKVFSKEKEIIHGIDLVLHRGERLGLIGESGSGKSLTCLSVMGLLPRGLHAEGSITLPSIGIDMLGCEESVKRSLRGSMMSMVFQEPMTALDPLMTVGKQIGDIVTIHQTHPTKRSELKRQILDMLLSVGLADVERIFSSRPYQLSGGQRQRVMLAMAMINTPKLLLADEPTTALDVTVQKKVTDLMDQQVTASNTSLLFITHDLGVVSGLCDQVAIMQQGRIVEYGKLADVFSHPSHPYTKALLAAAQLRRDSETHRYITLEDIHGNVISETRRGNTADVSANVPRHSDETESGNPKTPHDVKLDQDGSSLVFNRWSGKLGHGGQEIIEVSE
ncbi:ATP-binding cassette domain-containing protein, partial [Bifidobacterium thermophilum]|uniref:ATP-binding cassette domain-containing protein n=1 Tax=Bifidobacterium thermophilum TaxID=33905 RepID=UPI0039967B31